MAGVDDIDDGDQFRGIADSFADIPPKSYPLVVTFNKFLLMLDGTLGSSYFQRFHEEVESSYGGSTGSRSAALLMKRKEINYDKFCLSYWPHFNSQLTKRLDASRVFTEIISCIKGGLQVGETDGGRLSLEGYLDLSQGRTSTLSRQKRDAIYHIFLDYEKMKTERREYDLADFVNDLHRRLRQERYDGDFIDFVYIDEVQDLTMRQISLFKYICKNVDEGFIFSGDTAQTIARGIDFRFQDVRCLFFKEFLTNKTSERISGSNDKGHISPIFHLSENFRTHAGILKLGQSVIELIYHFFPHSIDSLPPETSLIFGEAPILLESGSDENAIVTIFGNTGNMGCNLVGFGAEQVILVRDDSARKEISDFVGKSALVLTIVECKGLEFQDVLLYNFFGSSPLKNQWRVVYEYMNLKTLLDPTLLPSFPEFNPEKHNVLCSELKQLYVAITRTRQRLWICENREDLSKPMFDYWKKLAVVQVRKLDDSLARAMQVASSPEEWKARGRKLLAVENYEVATMCFERAGDKHWEVFAKAAGLRASAVRMSVLNLEEASSILRSAAELFESIHEYRRAADCYYESKEYDKAGKLYFHHCDDSYLGRAGECLTLTGSYELAAAVFAKGNLYSECLSSCTKGKLFDVGLQYIEYWKHQKTAKDLEVIEQVFLENCALSQYQQDDKKEMMKFVKAFCSVDSMRTFLNKWECLDELLILEEELGNFSKAADIARDRGDFLLEADLLQKGGLFKEACTCFLWYVFASCLWAEGNKGWPLKHFLQEEELLLKAKAASRQVGHHFLIKTVTADVLILLDLKYSLSQLAELLVWSQDEKNLRVELISTKRILESLVQTHVSKYELETDLVVNLPMHSIRNISQNKVSLETLLHFWNSWKQTVLAILQYLGAVEENNTNDFTELGEFCLNYLGVRKLNVNSSTFYVCMYPDAEWLKEVPKRYFQKFGNLFSIDVHQLSTAARIHWSDELSSIAFKVLKALGTLHKSAEESPVSVLSNNRILLFVYEVTQLLSSMQSLKQTYQDTKLLQSYVAFSLQTYFRSIFPLDWRKAVCKDIICSREMDISSKAIEGFILNYNVPAKESLTYGQLGRVAMGLLGSPKHKPELYERVASRIKMGSPWKSFFEVLSECKRSEAVSRTASNHVIAAQAQPEFALAHHLFGALRDAYDANWRKARDFITPYCFLYLVDRLMISLLELQGRLVVTRSSLIEWFIHLEWKGSLIRDLSSDRSTSAFVGEAYCFLAGVLHGLLMNTQETVDWVKKVGIRTDNFRVLLLRLVTIMCLVHLNSERYLNKLLDVLNNQNVTSQLPKPFLRALRWENPRGILPAVASALSTIEDPIVIVSIRNFKSPLKVFKGVIVLDIADQNKDELLNILFLGKVNTCQGRVDSGNSLCSSSSSPIIANEGKVAEDFQSQKRGEKCLMFQDGSAWELFETLKLVRNDDSASIQRFIFEAAMMKVQVDELYKLMNAVEVVEFKVDSLLLEAVCMVSELWSLSILLGASEKQMKSSMLLIRDSVEKLLSGMHVFEHLFGPLIPPKEVTTCLEKNEAEKLKEDQDEGEAPKEGELSKSRDDNKAACGGGKQEASQGGGNSKGNLSKHQQKKQKSKGKGKRR